MCNLVARKHVIMEFGVPHLKERLSNHSPTFIAAQHIWINLKLNSTPKFTHQLNNFHVHTQVAG